MALGDGARVELSEDLSAENLMILTRGQGERGHLLGAIANRSDQAVQVSIDPGDGDAFTIDAPARSKVNLTHAGPVIEAVEMAPGATQPTTVSSPRAGAFTVEVPVLDGTLPHYDRFLDGVKGPDLRFLSTELRREQRSVLVKSIGGRLVGSCTRAR